MVKLLHKQIFQSGTIIIENRLDHTFYNYSTGAEMFAYDRIAESICDKEYEETGMDNKFEIYFDVIVKLNSELSSRASRQLRLVVNGIDAIYECKEQFQEDLLLLAAKLIRKLVSIGDKRIARVESGGECIMLITDDINE